MLCWIEAYRGGHGLLPRIRCRHAEATEGCSELLTSHGALRAMLPHDAFPRAVP